MEPVFYLNRPKITDEEIITRKNFEKLLEEYQAQQLYYTSVLRRVPHLKKITYLLLGVVLLSIYVFPKLKDEEYFTLPPAPGNNSSNNNLVTANSNLSDTDFVKNKPGVSATDVNQHLPVPGEKKGIAATPSHEAVLNTKTIQQINNRLKEIEWLIDSISTCKHTLLQSDIILNPLPAPKAAHSAKKNYKIAVDYREFPELKKYDGYTFEPVYDLSDKANKLSVVEWENITLKRDSLNEGIYLLQLTKNHRKESILVQAVLQGDELVVARKKYTHWEQKYLSVLQQRRAADALLESLQQEAAELSQKINSR